MSTDWSAQHHSGRPHFSPDDLAAAARAYRKAGLSFLPIATDGSKAPVAHLLPRVRSQRGELRRSWIPLRSQLPTNEQIERWYPPAAMNAGIGVITGQISGGLEVIDVDDIDIGIEFLTRLIACQRRWVRNIIWVWSPRPGIHGYYRCPTPERSQKLADRVDEHGRRKTYIETRGEGGFCIAPPSPPACHPNFDAYTFLVNRDLTDLKWLSADDRKELMAIARSFHQPLPRPVRSPQTLGGLKTPASNRPGDFYNSVTQWSTLLEKHRWAYVSQGNDGTDLWRRPGKQTGVSATTNYADSDLLYVFSSNAFPFEANTAYTKFAAYCLLECDYDFQEAAFRISRTPKFEQFQREKERRQSLYASGMQLLKTSRSRLST